MTTNIIMQVSTNCSVYIKNIMIANNNKTWKWLTFAIYQFSCNFVMLWFSILSWTIVQWYWGNSCGSWVWSWKLGSGISREFCSRELEESWSGRRDTHAHTTMTTTHFEAKFNVGSHVEYFVYSLFLMRFEVASHLKFSWRRTGYQTK